MTGIACAMRGIASASSEWRTIVTLGGFNNDFRHYSFYGGGDPGSISLAQYRPNVIIRSVTCNALTSEIHIQIQRTVGGALPQNYFRRLYLLLSDGSYKRLNTADATHFATFTGAGAGFPAERWTWSGIPTNAANMWFGASDPIGSTRTVVLRT